MQIRKLDEVVINQIAAGEVVERPAQLVKELVENAIDAGATELQIDFSNGGRSVKISDNGSGMSAEDLNLSVERHATSKISKTDDLWKLDSFGFRGEALASIAAVSKMQIWSGQGSSSSRMTIRFGEKSPLTDAGEFQGTQIIVEDLFENLPARLKFLKSDSSESTHIKSVLKSLALANESVSFRIRQDEKLVAFWPQANSFQDRVAQVLEVDASSVYVFSANDSSGFSAEVAMLPPNQVARNLKQLLTFVRGRSVVDRSLQQAVVEGFRGALMHGEYPIAVVKLDCPAAEVDVNVHPTKTQVKFRSPQNAFRVIYKAARNFIEQAPWIERVSAPKQDSFSEASSSSSTTSMALQNYIQKSSFESRSSYAQPNLFTHAAREEAPVSANPIAKNPSWSRLKVLSQAHLTYLVCESENGLMFIDQHAAHERVLFERLMSVWKTGEKLDIQQLLLPLTVDLTEDAVENLKSYLSHLQKMGIEIEVVGPQAVAISAYPSILKDSAIVELLPQVCDEIAQQGESFSFDKIIDDIFATMACHSAVRAGQTLSLDQMQKLLEQMDEFRESSFCPHGRPVYVEWKISDIERQFGRIN